MYRFYQKNKLHFSLAWIFSYVVLASAADSFSDFLGLMKVITAPMLLLFALLLLGWIGRHGLWEEYGLCSFKENRKNYLYFIPLFLITTTNLWNGIAINASVPETVLYILSMLCVGFIEEIVFRGFLFKAICEKNVKQAVLISSVTFGIGHIVNLLNGADFISTLLQICYATAVGFLFTIIFYKGKSLLPCIITHGVVNSLSVFAVQGSRTLNIITSLVLCAVSIGYALWIWKISAKTALSVIN